MSNEKFQTSKEAYASLDPASMVGKVLVWHPGCHTHSSYCTVEEDHRPLYRHAMSVAARHGYENAWNVLLRCDTSVTEVSEEEHVAMAALYNYDIVVEGRNGVKGPIFWDARSQPKFYREEGKLRLKGMVNSPALHTINPPECIHYEYDQFDMEVGAY